MFSSRGLFSGIACPYKDACVLPKCLFLHSNPDDTPESDVAVNGSNANAQGNVSSAEQHKRRKMKVNGSSNASKPGLAATPNGSSNSAQTLESTHPKVPTPSLAKKTSLATPKSKAPTQATSKQKKVEMLNPRFLKSSPASHDMRYKLLKALHDQLVRLNTGLKEVSNLVEEKALVLSDQDLITMALDFEERTAIDKPTIYSNIVKNRILAWKRMSVADWKEERAKEAARLKELKVVRVTKSSPADPPKLVETGLTKEQELGLLHLLYTPIIGLEKHGYVSSMPTTEEIDKAKKGMETAKGWEVCDRCKTRFQVFPGRREEDGALASGGTCCYHWGKAYWPEKPANDPKAGKGEKRYKCCGLALGDSLGCTQADTHVFKVSEVKRLAAIFAFEETPRNDDAPKMPVCFDCEMGYTVNGLELIRLTATAWPGGEELLDVLVRPLGEILDLNSRWSGVWPNQMADAIPWEVETNHSLQNSRLGQNRAVTPKLSVVSSPAVARSLLFKHLNPDTPLIGHGLENDLNATRIIHPTIIDTAILYPHKSGLPFRNSLKSLTLTLLQRHIQVTDQGKVTGHDSKEDARSAGDLVRWKIRDEWGNMKLKGWTVKNGDLTAPVEKKQGILTVEFLENESETSVADFNSKGAMGADAVKRGTKRSADFQISKGDEMEEGECEDEE